MMDSLRPRESTQRVGVVIVNLGGHDTLARALDSVIANGVAAGRITIVDNGTDAAFLTAIQSGYPELTLLRNEENAGFGKAANQGIQSRAEEFVLLLNNDAELASEAIAEFLRAFDADDSLGIAGGELRYPDGRLQSAFAPLPTLVEELLPRNLLRAVAPGRFRRTTGSSSQQYVESVFGACIFFRRKALEEVCGFDEDFFFYYEEVDLCRRARLKGWTIAYVPAAKAQHVLGQTAMRFKAGARIEMERSKMLYFRKTQGALPNAVLAGHLGFRSCVNALTCSVAYAFSMKRSEHLRQKSTVYTALCRWHLAGRPDGVGLPRRVS